MNTRIKKRLFAVLLSLLPAAVQAQFTFTTNNDGSLTITNYTGPGGNVVIPDNIGGRVVSSIGTYAFNRMMTLPLISNVSVPGTVTNLASHALSAIAGYAGAVTAIYFQGNAPTSSNAFDDGNYSWPTVYYLSGTSGWSTNFNNRSAQVWFPGQLQMMLSPTGAITDGAQWQVDGSAWQTNGGMIGSLSYGNQTVSYKSIKGWRAPDDQIVFVGTNFITTVTANGYSALPGGPSQTTFQIMHSFPGDSTVQGPAGSLILISNRLYGTTVSGGVSNAGMIFAINTDGSGFTNLYSSGGSAGFIESSNVLYGTTGGTVFKINVDGSGFTTLCSNLAGVNTGIVLWSNTVYGTTSNGGNVGNDGTLFAVNTDGTGFNILHYFGSDTNDGALPLGGLVLSGNMLYGTSHEGIVSHGGTPFAIRTDGSGYTNFPYRSSFALTLALSGNTLYGDSGPGLFKMKLDGSGFTSLCSVNTQGAAIAAGNTLYGPTMFMAQYPWQPGYYGTVYAVHTDGTGFTNLWSLTGGSGGDFPAAPLLLSGTTLFGTTLHGGANGDGGTVFMLSFPPPQLNIKSSGTNVILTWPDGVSGAGYDLFSVQSTTSLTPPIIWNTVSTPPALVNGLNTVTNPISGTPTFYRLSQ